MGGVLGRRRKGRQKRHRMSLLGCKTSRLVSFIGTERGNKLLENAQDSKKTPLEGVERRRVLRMP